MVAQVFHDEFDPLTRLGRRDEDRVTAATVKALVRVAGFWKLKAADAAELAGVSPRTWERMKSGTWSGRLSKDRLHRASALIGLYKGLHLYFSDDLADRWVSMANKGPMFGGRRPVDIMAEGGLPMLIDVRAYVDALRGGM